jgi:hypothetical protein
MQKRRTYVLFWVLRWSDLNPTPTPDLSELEYRLLKSTWCLQESHLHGCSVIKRVYWRTKPKSPCLSTSAARLVWRNPPAIGRHMIKIATHLKAASTEDLSACATAPEAGVVRLVWLLIISVQLQKKHDRNEMGFPVVFLSRRVFY